MKFIIAIIAATALVGCAKPNEYVDPVPPVIDQNQAFKAVCIPDPTGVKVMVCTCENSTGATIDCPTDLVEQVDLIDTPPEPPLLNTPE